MSCSMHGGGAADEAKVAQLTKTLAGRLEAYDVILSKHKYLAGDSITLADLFHLYVSIPVLSVPILRLTSDQRLLILADK
jgi:glutathione S-transferase